MSNSLQISDLSRPEAARFEKIHNSGAIKLYKLKNKHDLEATISNCGARLTSFLVKDRKGNFVDIVIGPGKTNNWQNTNSAVDDLVWTTKQADEQIIVMKYPSKDRQHALVDKSSAKLTYLLNDDNCLKIIYEVAIEGTSAVSEPNTVFFNLNGANSGNILNHQVWIKADSYLPIDAKMTLTGEIEPVTGTPFDFRNSATIGSRINDHHVQLKNGNGFDHYFVLNKHASRTPVAKTRGDRSGIIMELFTDQPGLQFYSGNLHQNSITNLSNKEDYRVAFAMNPRHFFDLPAQLQYGRSTGLRHGHFYRSVCCYRLKN